MLNLNSKFPLEYLCSMCIAGLNCDIWQHSGGLTRCDEKPKFSGIFSYIFKYLHEAGD